MRKPQGYATITGPDAGFVCLDDKGRRSETQSGVTEIDTFSCGHCGSVRHVKPRENPEDIGGLCKQCMKLICPVCVNTGRCDPLEKKLERAEERDRVLRSYGL